MIRMSYIEIHPHKFYDMYTTLSHDDFSTMNSPFAASNFPGYNINRYLSINEYSCYYAL